MKRAWLLRRNIAGCIAETTAYPCGRSTRRASPKAGSAWKHQDYDDPTIVDIVGQVVESSPPRCLVMTWAAPATAGNPAKTSRVTYQIEPYEDLVRLTVMHEDLEPDSEMLCGITSGWPAVLSSLKTFLETGKPMSTLTQRRSKAPG